VLLLVNPRARGGKDPVDDALAVLTAAGVSVKTAPFELAAEPSAMRARSAGADAIVVCGGDGSVSAAAAGVVAAGVPLGIVPIGTANDLARTLGIPPDPVEAARVVVAGRTRRIDVGEVNGRLFFNVASIGMSVEIARRLTPEIKRRWGRLGYGIAALRALAAARPFHATVAGREGAARVRTLQIAVGNGRHYGGGAVVAPEAAIDDGKLDLYSLEVASAWKLPLMLRDIRRGTHGTWREVRTADGTGFEIRTRRPRPVNADGEIVTMTPARFAIRPGAVTVFAPAAPPAAV
jgi:YegS/Rv2252/BmrU family lipid kinase